MSREGNYKSNYSKLGISFKECAEAFQKISEALNDFKKGNLEKPKSKYHK